MTTAKPCVRIGPHQECAQCGARGSEECPYESLTDGLQQTPAVQVTGGDCSGEDGVCPSCQ